MIATVVGIVLVVPRLSLAQWELTDGNDQLSRVSIAYIPPSNSTFQALYEVLKDHRALKKIQEILSPLRWPEELTNRWSSSERNGTQRLRGQGSVKLQ